MKPSVALPRSPADLAALFADRERLTGRARERFLNLLHETLIPAIARSHTRWRELGLSSLMFTPAAIALFRLAHSIWPPAWFIVGCIAYSFIGIALVLGYRRAREISRTNIEVSWATYCAHFRPALLQLVPGLLDRNLPADCSERVSVRVHRAVSLHELWRDRDEEFWSANLLGLGVGVLLMSIWITFGPASPELLLIPVPVGAIVVTAWLAWNRRTLKREASRRPIVSEE